MTGSGKHCQFPRSRRWTSINGRIERFFGRHPKIALQNYFEVRGDFVLRSISFAAFVAPRADRNLAATDRYIHPSKDRTIDEQRPDDLPPLPMPAMETTLFTRDQFSIDALAFMDSSLDTYPIYRFEDCLDRRTPL
jgi:hypothetical protein